MKSYEHKFNEHIKKCNFNILDQETKDFIKTKAFKYRLSFQELKTICDIAIDLKMWDEEDIKDIWEDFKDKKKSINSLKEKYENIRNSPKSYQNFTFNDPIKKYSTYNYDKEIVGFGRCPVASPKTRCCNLLTLDAVESCGFDCSYCSIQSFYNQNKVGFIENFEEKLKKIKLDPSKIYHIGTGQSSDSLMWGNRNNILETLFKFAKDNPNVILELKTKSNNIDYLLKNEIPKNVITTWSLNPQIIIDNEEHLTASLEERINSAKAIANKGNLVGFHFHPIIYYKDYLKDYKEIVDRLLSNFNPKYVAMVSLGTLTFIKPVIKQLRQRALKSKILQMPLTPAGGKLSYPLKIKEEMFKSVYNFFKPWHNKVYFYMCMEDHSLWKRVFGYEYSSNEEMEEDMLNAYLTKIKGIS